MADVLKGLKLFGPEMQVDPYPMYDRIRESGGVYWNEELASWFLARYEDVAMALRSPLLSADRAAALQRLTTNSDLEPFFRFLSSRMLYNDPPRHIRLRTLVSKAFTPHAVEARATHIRQVVDDLLDRGMKNGQMDIVRDLAFPLPAIVIAEMLGVPPTDRDQLKAWSDTFVVYFTKPPAQVTETEYRNGLGAVHAMTAYFHEIVERRRVEPKADLLTAMVQAEDAGDRLSDEELYGNANLLLVAGHETTTGLIGSGVLALLKNPEQCQILRDDPTLIPHAVEEFLRYDGPVHFTHRIASEDMTVGGKTIRKGQWVHLLLAAANRDPAQFRDPNRLDVRREPNHHLAFGAGLHFCLGAPLARLEARIAFTRLLERAPNMRLAGQPIRYRPSFNARGPESLVVTF